MANTYHSQTAAGWTWVSGPFSTTGHQRRRTEAHARGVPYHGDAVHRIEGCRL